MTFRRIPRPAVTRAAPCDWDFQTHCYTDGCHNPATHSQTMAVTEDGDEVVAMVCCGCALVTL